MTEERKQSWQTLGLVDDDLPWVDIAFEIGLQQPKIGRSLQFDVSSARQHVTHEGAFATLPGSQDKDTGEVPQKTPEASGHRPVDIVHAS